jgi:hypothetical protein
MSSAISREKGSHIHFKPLLKMKVKVNDFNHKEHFPRSKNRHYSQASSQLFKVRASMLASMGRDSTLSRLPG